MTFDVVALGELLIDFTQYSLSDQGNMTFEANPGGAPCNMLAMLQHLGRKTAFIGKVGKDRFGSLLREAVSELGIDTSALCEDEETPTTLAFVHKLPNGDRDFSFYRTPGADVRLSAADVPEAMLKDTRVFHFGTLSMTDDPARTATVRAIRIAKKSGAILTFDPNYRPPLWHTDEAARAAFDVGFAACDMLKISDNEILWYTGCETIGEGVAVIRAAFPNIRLLLATLGPDGSRAYWNDLEVFVPAFLRTDTVETTGAGDTFCACCISALLEYGLDGFDEEKLTEMLRFANAAASIITTRKGALRVMPTLEEIRASL